MRLQHRDNSLRDVMMLDDLESVLQEPASPPHAPFERHFVLLASTFLSDLHSILSSALQRDLILFNLFVSVALSQFNCAV